MNFEDLIETVPDYKRFYTVDELNERSLELAKKYPDKVKVYQAGSSRKGDPIYVLEIGKGSKNALLFGCPHPNEPIGAMMLDYLSEQLATNEELLNSLDYTWHIIKVIDTDGTRLNEGWFNDSSSIRKYAGNFYRPPGHEQVEWTFPIDYKTLHFHSPLPETEILMKLMEEKKPEFMYSLHNAGFGGVYYYISEDSPELYERFSKLPGKFSLPLSLGEPEAPFLEELAPAIFKLFGMQQEYDYLEKNLGEGKDPAEVIRAGTSSDDYASSVSSTYALVCEMPYYYDPRIDNQSEAGITRKEALKLSNDMSMEQYEFVSALLTEINTEITDKESPFYTAIKNYVDTTPDHLNAVKNWIEGDESLNRQAKVSEEFDNVIVRQFYGSLMLGMLNRLIKENLEKKPENEILKNAMAKAEKEFDERIKYLEDNLNYKTIPIKSLVCVQLLAGLYTAEYLERG